MNTLTLKNARKVLGKIAQDVSDEQLQKDIDAATLLKDFFFENLVKSRKKPINSPPNVP